MKSPRIVAGIILAFCLLFPAHASPSEFTGKTITRIDIKDDQGKPWPRPEQVLALITLHPGASYSGPAVRDSISLLYLKGIFRDIRVDAFPEENGVRLEFILFPTTIVGKIAVHGNDAVSTSAITDAVASLEGRELRDEKLSAARTDILALYQAGGFYEASVAFRTEPLTDANRVLLRVDIREGAPTVIEEIALSGNTVFKDKELLAVMKSKKGSRLNRDRLLDADMEAILKKYTDEGYPAARPGPVDIRFRDSKAYVRVPGSEGPKVSVRFIGNSVFSASRLTKALLIWSEHDVSDAVLDSSVDAIKTLYRDRGYADVAVDVKKLERPGALDLAFTVQEGPRVTVRAITVSGNTVFTSRAVKDQMALRESGWFTSRPFREDLLDKDIDYLRDQYLRAGYLSAQVNRNITRSSDGRHAVVAIEIAEGPLTRTGNVSFEGNRLFSAAQLLDTVALKPGAPFNDQVVDEDKYRLLAAYANQGYLYSRVDVDQDLHDGVVDVRYRITEDLPVLIGRIILRGNETTRDRVITRELLIKTGDLYNYGAILDSQQRIYRLGYFRVARFEPVRPGEKEYVKDMLFIMEERPAGAVELGIGYGDLDRLRGFVEVSHRNLWGSARYANLRYEESDILRRAIFNYQEPWFLNRKLGAKFSLVWSDSDRLNSDTREIYYSTRKTTAAFGVERAYTRLKPSITYQFENVENYHVKPEAQLTPEDSGRVLVSSLSPALVWDGRDDVFNPRRGAVYGVVLKESLKELGSEADFSKLTVQTSFFLPLGANVVTALSARAGMAWPFRETPEVPLHERFYMGGNTTVRGYTQDSIGPSTKDANGDSIPLGGASMAVCNLEFRLFPGEGLGFALFGDAGNVWPDQSIRLDDLRASYGIGLRYGTPIGPLRIDYGQKINRKSGESPGEFHFNIGHAF